MERTLYIIFHGRFPSEKAASFFTAKNAENFGKEMKVVVIVPRRFGRLRQSPFEYYNVKNNFEVRYVPTLDLYPLNIFGFIAFPLSYFVFSIFTLIYLLLKAPRKSVFYSNEHLSLFTLSFFFKNLFYEMHDFPTKKAYFYYRFFLKRVTWILIHNNWKAKMAKDYLGVLDSKIICEPNAVEIQDFDIDISKEDARKSLSLPVDKKIVVYTGHLYGWKGADILAEASHTLPEEVMVYFVGGTEDDVSHFKSRFPNKNIVFVGHRMHKEIPLWQRAADALVIPNTAKEDISKYYTSPMKLFEYMASGRPIIASKIPSIEEIVTEEEVSFFDPDNSESLRNVILENLSNPKESMNKVIKARIKVAKHTWQGRAGRILEFIKQSK